MGPLSATSAKVSQHSITKPVS